MLDAHGAAPTRPARGRIRVIPVLLLRHWGLEKTVRFQSPVYIGSPINAVRVFNGLNADELIVLDIAAGEEGRGPSLDVVAAMTEGAFMPVAVGGGIRSLEAIRQALDAGADRVTINAAAVEDPGLVSAAAARFGSQCIVVSLDVRRHPDGRYEVFTRRGRRPTGLDPVEQARRMQEAGAGEVLLTSIERDGTLQGYDLELTRRVSDALSIPVIACGGAGETRHFADAVCQGHASAVAAGAAFLFYGRRRAVLVHYPTDEELVASLGDAAVRRRGPNPPVLPAEPEGPAAGAASRPSHPPPGAHACRRCVLDTSVPGVALDGDGECSHCRLHDRLDRLYPAGEQGRRRLEQLAGRIRRSGRGRRYDCMVGLSGGRDTSYCLHQARELGLRPLAVHFDNGWDAAIAKQNIRRLCSALDVDLHVKVADWVESRELTNCTLRAGVPYIDMTDDVGIARCLFEAAAGEGARYILLSHSFREEGINPLAWNYFDGRYFRALVRRFATIPIRKLRNVDLHHLAYWQLVRGIRVVNLTNYYQDAGRHVEDLLERRYGWVDTHQHHFDNELFALVSYYSRRRFGFDWRVVELSAKVRSGVMTREQALAALERPPVFETEENVAYCLRKQGISPEEWQRILDAPRRYFWDYPNYFAWLKLLKQPVKWLGRLDVLPSYVYEKYFET